MTGEAVCCCCGLASRPAAHAAPAAAAVSAAAAAAVLCRGGVLLRRSRRSPLQQREGEHKEVGGAPKQLCSLVSSHTDSHLGFCFNRCHTDF